MYKVTLKQRYHETSLKYECVDQVMNLLCALHAGNPKPESDDDVELSVTITFENEEGEQ